MATVIYVKEEYADLSRKIAERHVKNGLILLQAQLVGNYELTVVSPEDTKNKKKSKKTPGFYLRSTVFIPSTAFKDPDHILDHNAVVEIRPIISMKKSEASEEVIKLWESPKREISENSADDGKLLR